MTDKRFGMPFWVGFGVTLIQYVSTQAVVFILSLFINLTEEFVTNQSGWFALLLTGCYSIGVYGVGWAALRVKLLRMEPLLLQRLAGTVLGAAIPLFIGLLISGRFAPGNPAFFIAMITTVMGFYIPSWIKRR